MLQQRLTIEKRKPKTMQPYPESSVPQSTQRAPVAAAAVCDEELAHLADGGHAANRGVFVGLSYGQTLVGQLAG